MTTTAPSSAGSSAHADLVRRMLVKVPRTNRAVTGAAVVGAVLMLISAYIHFHLWSGAYKHIPTIGPLFLLQSITAVVGAVAVIAFTRPAVLAAMAGFMVSTVAGFLLSVYVGLFGFTEFWSAPYAVMAFVIETSGSLVLLGATAMALRPAASN